MICADLETTVRHISPDVPVVLIENAPGSGDRPTAGSGLEIRRSLGLDATTPVALYTGTFEHYQGLDLLYAAMGRVVARRPDARLVLVGGDATQIAQARRQIAALGLAAHVVLTGQRPAEEIPAYLDAATVLVSPRSTGTNTPLKIYQYLRSGRAIIATNLRTHTQVLEGDFAFLAAPTPRGLPTRCSRRSTNLRGPPPSGRRPARLPRRATATRCTSRKQATPAKPLWSRPRHQNGSEPRMTLEPEPRPDGQGAHYSYAHYADRDVAAGFHELRFGGPIGQHLEQVQQALLVEALSPLSGRRIPRRGHRHRSSCVAPGCRRRGGARDRRVGRDARSGQGARGRRAPHGDLRRGRRARAACRRSVRRCGCVFQAAHARHRLATLRR